MKLTHVRGGTTRRWLLPVFAVLSLALAPALQAASNVQGSINGRVVTEDGNAVSGATVTATSLGTGLVRSEQTNEDGQYSFSSLPVGQYRVTADAAGMPQAVREPVTVNIGTGTNVRLLVGAGVSELERVTVTGRNISPIDIRSTESATILGEQTIDRLPVGRNLTDIALLAPGTTRGDSAFGNLASFGGATVGENVCYINGLNVTNFRNGLGCSTVPFEFYQEFQIKTGGYSAEFGRATGGVINAATKSGSNEFESGATLYYQPWIEGFSGASPNSYTPGTGGIFDDNRNDEDSSWNASLWASGPIVSDKAFFYVLYNPRNREFDDYNGSAGTAYFGSDDDAFWGTKLDWYLTNDHVLELTAFNDSSTLEQDSYGYTWNSPYNRELGDYVGTFVDESGGQNWVVKYTGYLTQDFTLSASYGKNEYALTSVISNFDEPLVRDIRSGTSVVVNNPVGGGPYGVDEDEREQYRVDGEWILGDHQLRFGVDYEENTANTSLQYSGGAFYRIEGDDTVFRQMYQVDGAFATITDAMYIEDTWQVSDTFVISAGLRNERFENQNHLGEAFISIDNQIAPRLGFSWDALGDGTLKVFGNYGRYFLPIATNTNVRMTGNEDFRTQYFDWDGTFDETGAPNLGAPQTEEIVYADGSAPDTRSVVDQNIDPMYQDELILGVLKDMGNNWSLGARFIHRDLKSTIEDLTTDQAFDALGFSPQGCGIGAFHYVLANPGSDITMQWDCPTGTMETYTLSAEDLAYPESERYYNAIELLFERMWDGQWFLQGSYTWSQSYGNNEGYVRSDNGQNDAGLTTLYDFAGLMDGSYGYLPNDRRHALKVFGAWQLTDNWQVGANLLMQSGRPVSAFGNHPTDPFSALYGSESFYQNGELVQRGSRGSTPFTSSLDLSLKYMTMIGGTDAVFGVDIFNVFDSGNATEVREISEFDFSGDPDPNYGLPTSFQRPRAIRFSASVQF